MTASQVPKLFVSYCWSSPAHEQWVIDLATEVVGSGVEVILDKWDLREGNDSIAFMEKMVTDPSITKVLMICDRTYASKADGRAGGVGTETQIISREVYEREAQDRFVAVVAEKDEAGKPYLPTYYKSRIYIDLSEPDRYAEGFEKLLRWIFDKPLYVKPEIGKVPSFLADVTAPLLGTSPLAKRVIEGFRNDTAYARGALDEYLTLFAENMERFRLKGTDGEKDDWIFKSIEDFTPSRNELLHVLTTLSQYGDAAIFGPRLHRFFENLIPYLSRPASINQWSEDDFDNYKFIVHELFLYALAILLRGEHFGAATHMLSQTYYAPSAAEYGRNPATTFTIFRDHLRSFEVRNKRLALGRLSVRADLLEQRSRTSGLSFQNLMQADFICFLRADLANAGRYDGWYPETLLYAVRHHGPFEVFARATSNAYLTRVLPVLGVSTLAEVKQKMDEYAADRTSIPRWQGQSFSPFGLMGFEQLGTKN